jgi:hypothetical protein
MHLLNNKFDNIYVLYINDFELNRIKPKLLDKSIEVEYFKGVIGKDDRANYVSYLKNLKKGESQLNHGSFGHIRSFINIMKDAIKNNYNNILIMEPDIYFCKYFEQKCNRYLDMDYKLLYLGASQNKYYSETTWEHIENTQNDLLKKGYYNCYKTLGTFCLGIDKSIFQEVLDELCKYKSPTDVTLLTIQSKYANQCIVTYPNIISCDLAQSNTSISRNMIESAHQLRWNLDYEYNDIITVNTQINQWYLLTIDINSFLPDYKIIITDYPEINAKNANILGNNILGICILSRKDHISVTFQNVFINNHNIKAMAINFVKVNPVVKRVLRHKKNQFHTYYISNLFKK